MIYICSDLFWLNVPWIISVDFLSCFFGIFFRFDFIYIHLTFEQQREKFAPKYNAWFLFISILFIYLQRSTIQIIFSSYSFHFRAPFKSYIHLIQIYTFFLLKFSLIRWKKSMMCSFLYFSFIITFICFLGKASSWLGYCFLCCSRKKTWHSVSYPFACSFLLNLLLQFIEHKSIYVSFLGP